MNIHSIEIVNGSTIRINRMRRGYSEAHKLDKLTISSRQRLQAIALLNKWSFDERTTYAYETFRETDIETFTVADVNNGQRYLLWYLLSGDEQDALYEYELAKVR